MQPEGRPDCVSRSLAKASAAATAAAGSAAAGMSVAWDRRCTESVVAAPVEPISPRKSPAESNTSGLLVVESFTNDGGSSRANGDASPCGVAARAAAGGHFGEAAAASSAASERRLHVEQGGRRDNTTAI
eukprot:7259709-Prymnesium_polylepis.1